MWKAGKAGRGHSGINATFVVSFDPKEPAPAGADNQW